MGGWGYYTEGSQALEIREHGIELGSLGACAGQLAGQPDSSQSGSTEEMRAPALLPPVDIPRFAFMCQRLLSNQRTPGEKKLLQTSRKCKNASKAEVASDCGGVSTHGVGIGR